jgi:hypothetical protein
MAVAFIQDLTPAAPLGNNTAFSLREQNGKNIKFSSEENFLPDTTPSEAVHSVV